MRKLFTLLVLLAGIWFVTSRAVHAQIGATVPTSAPAFQSVVSSTSCTVTPNATTFCFTSDKGFLQSVNGATFVAVGTTGVTSFNGQTGVVVYNPPVTSVNGKTGAVVLGVSATLQ